MDLMQLVEVVATIIIALITAVLGPAVIERIKAKSNVSDPQKGKRVIERLKLDNAVNSKLKQICYDYGADRASITLFHNGGMAYSGLKFDKLSITHEHVLAGIKPMMLDFQGVNFSSYSGVLLEAYHAGYTTRPLEDEKHDLFDFRMRDEFGILKQYIFPIISIQGNYIGIMSVGYIRGERGLDPKQIEDLRECAISMGGYVDKDVQV